MERHLYPVLGTKLTEPDLTKPKGVMQGLVRLVYLNPLGSGQGALLGTPGHQMYHWTRVPSHRTLCASLSVCQYPKKSP